MTEILYIPKLNEIVLFDHGKVSFNIHTKTLTLNIQCSSKDILKLMNLLDIKVKDTTHIGWL